MLKKKTIGITVCMTVICTATAGVLIYRNPNKKSTLEEDILKVEEALGDEYKKQSETTLAATLTYGSKDDKTEIYYHILKTDYYEQNASEITGLNTVAFGVLFPVEFMDSCEEMKIQEWPAALYKKGEMAYLCWTYSPEISYVLEYKPAEIQDSEIIKMAESAKERDQQGVSVMI